MGSYGLRDMPDTEMGDEYKEQDLSATYIMQATSHRAVPAALSKSLVIHDELNETRHRLMPIEEPVHKHSMQVAQQAGYASLNKEVKQN